MVVLNVAQWLLSPYLVGWIYKVKEMPQNENLQVHQMVSRFEPKKRNIFTKTNVVPNSTAKRIRIWFTINRKPSRSNSRTFKELDDGEVEAVLGHELGHLKHRDVQVMMVVSFLPALFYYIGYSMMLSGMFGGGERKTAAETMRLFGIAFMAFSWVLTLFTLVPKPSTRILC